MVGMGRDSSGDQPPPLVRSRTTDDGSKRSILWTAHGGLWRCCSQGPCSAHQPCGRISTSSESSITRSRRIADCQRRHCNLPAAIEELKEYRAWAGAFAGAGRPIAPGFKRGPARGLALLRPTNRLNALVLCGWTIVRSMNLPCCGGRLPVSRGWSRFMAAVPRQRGSPAETFSGRDGAGRI